LNIPLRTNWNLLASYTASQRARVTLLAVLLFSGITLQLLNPQIVRFFIDTATSGGALASLITAALLYLGGIVLQQSMLIGANYVGEDLGWRVTNQLRIDLIEHCLQLDLTFHNARTPGEMIERIDGDVTALANFFSQLVILVLGNLLLLIGILCLLFIENVWIGLTVGIFTLGLFAALARQRNLAVPHWEAAREASANLFGYLEERLGGTEAIRSSGAVAYVLRGFYTRTRDLWHASRRAWLMVNVMMNTTWFLTALGNTAAFIVSASLFQDGSLTIGTIYLVFSYLNMLTQPVQSITNKLDDLQRASASIVRIQELRQARSTIHDIAPDVEGNQLPVGALAVEFRNVSFAYQTAAVLRQISFTIQPGTVLGLLGRTGSGKTTISRLLLRLYEPSEGVILFGGQPIDQLRLADLRRRVGIVTQNVQLFHATLRDILTLFNRTIPDQLILNVLHDLDLWEWYTARPHGLDSILEADSLSAGEAQLLAFARVFLRDPDLVILDEASSRLDPATEQRIERAVEKLLQNRTAIIIAHRLETVRRADTILILDRGTIVEYGPREELACNQASQFSRLLKAGLKEAAL